MYISCRKPGNTLCFDSEVDLSGGSRPSDKGGGGGGVGGHTHPEIRGGGGGGRFFF